MGMFQSPYDRGGVLSKEAIAERKKIYRDERSPEERKKGNRELILLFLPLVPLTLIPGFFPKAGLSRTAYLMIPYALEAIAVVLSAVCLGAYLYESKGKTLHKEDGSVVENAIDGRSYRRYFQGLIGRAAISCFLGISFVFIEILYLLLAKEDKNILIEGVILLVQVGFFACSRGFYLKTKQVICNWRL